MHVEGAHIHTNTKSQYPIRINTKICFSDVVLSFFVFLSLCASIFWPFTFKIHPEMSRILVLFSDWIDVVCISFIQNDLGNKKRAETVFHVPFIINYLPNLMACRFTVSSRPWKCNVSLVFWYGKRENFHSPPPVPSLLWEIPLPVYYILPPTSWVTSN